MMDQIFRKLIRPNDPRGKIGQMSRGKPIYRGGFTGPNPASNFDLKRAVVQRYRDGRK